MKNFYMVCALVAVAAILKIAADINSVKNDVKDTKRQLESL